MSLRPIIGIPADRRMVGPHPFHMVGEKYAHAVSRAAGALPLLVPVLPEPLEIAERPAEGCPPAEHHAGADLARQRCVATVPGAIEQHA